MLNMIDFIVALVVFVFILGFLVTLHEFGHFYFAKKAGILCSEFSIGMGPIIYRVKKGETYWSIRAIPVGGFVSMAGEDMNESLIKVGSTISLQLENELVTEIILNENIDGDIQGEVISRDMYGKDSNDLYIELNVNGEMIKYNIAEECYYVLSKNQKVAVAPYDRCFESKTLKERFLAIIAGPVMNLIIALVLFMMVGLATGVATNENVIGSVTTNTAQLYLEEGDVITKIGDYTVDSWDDIGVAMNLLQAQGATTIPMVIDREGEKDKPVNVKATIQILNVGISNLNLTKDQDGYVGPGIVLGSMATGNRAYESGLREGDVLLSVMYNGEEHYINTWLDAMTFFKSVGDVSAKVSFNYSRDGVESTTNEVVLYDEATLTKLKAPLISYTIGITATTKFDFIGGLQNGLILTWENATMIFTTLGLVLNPSVAIGVSDLSGPIGIFGMVQDYMDAGFIAILSLVGMLSVNLFIVNLLPFPALDGGRLVFLGVEGVTKKPVNKNVENNINFVGFVLLMALMLYITFQDVLRL